MGENDVKELNELRVKVEKIKSYGKKYRDNKKKEIEELKRFKEKWFGKKIGNVVIE